MIPIKLGRKYEPCAPCGLSDSKPGSNIAFPSVYLSAKSLGEIPRAGEITFRYELGSRNENFKNDTDDVCMDLLLITNVKETEEAKKKLSTEEELDKLAAEVVGDDDDEDESDDKEQYVEGS